MEYKCVNGHDRCNEMYSGPECPYCEKEYIHKKNGKFYFWDEIGYTEYGPYDTYEEANSRFVEYCYYLEGGK